MRRFIRYLYEYENGKRMRNVGFVKVDQSDDECIVHIHGKGLRLEGEKELSVYLFYEKGGECIGIPQGTVENVNPAVNYQLKYTKDDVGEPGNYSLIEGIIMENRSHRKYAAVWDDMPVNVNEMRLWMPADLTAEAEEEPEHSPEEELEALPEEPSEPAGETDSEPMPEHLAEPTPEQRPESKPERLSEPEFEATDEFTEEPASEYDIVPEEENDEAGFPEEEQEPAEVESFEEEAAEPDNAAEPEDTAGVSAGEQPVEPLEDAEVTETACCREQGKKCTKIQRQDMVQLPRCEWRLSNNSFLLHGYYNYHHLVLIEEEGNTWLGVPGIYHPKEAKAAEAFGFPQFIRVDKVEVDLDEEERNDGETFGYWCRHIRNRG